MVLATGVAADGNREVLGLDESDSKDEVFWTQFLRSLKQRGLDGVKLVVSDAHPGLKQAIERVFQGSAWQRCKVHLIRNLMTHIPKSHKQMIGATVRTIFVQPNAESVRTRLRQVVGILETRYPKAAELLSDAEHDVTAYAEFPQARWSQTASTNPLERVNKAIKRRSNVIGIFPNDESVIRLVGAVLAEQHDEWQAADKRHLSEGSMNQIGQQLEQIISPHTPELPAA